MEKRETVNTINLAGILVDKELQIKDDNIDKTTGDTYTSISGKLVIRTEDGSEVEVNAYSKELTKAGKENTIYKGLVTVMDEYKTLKEFPNEADKVRVGACDFGINDYLGKQDGIVKSFNKINAKFFNRLTPKDLELTKLTSKFEVEGVIAEMKDITKKDGTPTGDKLVVLNTLGYEGTIIPVTLTLPQALVQPFQSMGYYEGTVATLWGKIINIETEEVIVEQAGFGEANEKTVKKTSKRKEITGGKPPVDLTSIGYTQEEYNQAVAKRKVKLDGLKSGSSDTNANDNPFATGGQSTPQGQAFNPFAQQ